MPLPSATRIGALLGFAALVCGVASLGALFSAHPRTFFVLLYASALIALGGLISTLLSIAVSGGRRRLDGRGLLVALIGVAMPLLFTIALVESLARVR